MQIDDAVREPTQTPFACKWTGRRPSLRVLDNGQDGFIDLKDQRRGKFGTYSPVVLMSSP